MSQSVTVDLNTPTPYAEPASRLYRFRRRLTMRPVLRQLRRFVPRRSDFKFLEIGTGSGFLLKYVEDKYPNATLLGIEYDPRLVELTQSKLGRARVRQGNAESLDLGDEMFDVAVSLQVVEHLYHPERMLAAVHRHLAPGGRLVLTTPNVGCLSNRVMGSRWHGYRHDHVSLKTRAQWAAFVESCGFRTLYSGSTFFSGIPLLNRFPLGMLNWLLLLIVGSLQWDQGESFIGVFERRPSHHESR